jgi:hypothetical protein
MLRILIIIILGLFVNFATAQKTFSPAKEALKLFNAYKPTIEKNNDAIVDKPNVVTGDLNGDGKIDCIIWFVMTSKEGGNAIIGQDAAIYINKGTEMKVIGNFNLDICYSVEKIKNQTIYIKEHECAPPYDNFIRTKKYRLKERKLIEVK